MRGRWRGRRGAALVVAGSLAITGVSVGMARATSSLDEALASRRFLGRQLVMLHHRLHDRRVQIQKQIDALEAQLPGKLRTAKGDAAKVSRSMRKRQHLKLLALKQHQRDVIRAIKAQKAGIRQRQNEVADWIDTYGIFSYCPVAGPLQVADNFGVIVDLPGVPVHIHQGDDIMAPTGTPIVAPFDGTAVATSSELGGLAVEVYGRRGARVQRPPVCLRKLGPVKAGTIIGYVGSTGDATAPHDHFEWHPNDGPRRAIPTTVPEPPSAEARAVRPCDRRPGLTPRPRRPSA